MGREWYQREGQPGVGKATGGPAQRGDGRLDSLPAGDVRVSYKVCSLVFVQEDTSAL